VEENGEIFTFLIPHAEAIDGEPICNVRFDTLKIGVKLPY